MRALLAITAIFLLCLPSFSQATSPPVPPKKNLEKQAENIQGDLKSSQKKLIKLASSIQKNEASLQKLDKQIYELETQQGGVQKALQEDQKALADVVMALQRIRRLPPEALIAKPDTPLETAQSAMLMKNMLPGLYEQAESLKANLEKMETLESELRDKRKDVKKASAKLQEEHSKLSTLVEKREKLYRATQKDIEAREKKARKIAQKARSVKDLVKNLDEERKKRTASKKTARATPKSIPKVGQARLPISGIIKTGYNEPDNFGAPNQGIDIEGRGGALVVAPMGGVIRFSGAFKNYGNMVIIEHKKGYHSLVAGLEKLDTVVGQSVEAGEPLGKLHYAEAGEKPVLYYELRYNGKAINPAKKISGLT